MLLWIWYRNDGQGLDDDFKDGDIDHADYDTAPVGAQEKKSWLIVKVDDPPAGVIDDVIADYKVSEYAPGESFGDEPVTRRKRRWKINWRNQFTAEEIAAIVDPNQEPINSVNGIVEGKFTRQDVKRK